MSHHQIRALPAVKNIRKMDTKNDCLTVTDGQTMLQPLPLGQGCKFAKQWTNTKDGNPNHQIRGGQCSIHTGYKHGGFARTFTASTEHFYICTHWFWCPLNTAYY
jgi:hypothetical protein